MGSACHAWLLNSVLTCPMGSSDFFFFGEGGGGIQIAKELNSIPLVKNFSSLVQACTPGGTSLLCSHLKHNGREGH